MNFARTYLRCGHLLVLLVLLTRTGLGETPPLLTVTAEPEKKSFVEASDLSFRFSVTNNSEQYSLSFSTCPAPYDVALLDSQGRPVPLRDSYQHSPGTHVYVCESTIMEEIKPGETWGPEVWPTPDRGMFDLRPGTYTGRLLWHFGLVDKAGTELHEIIVPSNVFTVVVVPRN
jgi:hypothetical protein